MPLLVWFQTLSAILLKDVGGGSCSCCYCVKVKSSPSLDLALGVWQKKRPERQTDRQTEIAFVSAGQKS